MLPIEREIGLAGATGWALFDWQGNATGRPTFTRVAGGMSSARIQLDRYRRFLQMPGWGSQIQLWVWSSATFTVWTHSNAVGAVPESFGPHVYPEAATVETAVTPREARFVAAGGVYDWDAGTYHTGRTTAAAQMTIAGRFFGHYTLTQIDNGTGRRIWFDGSARVRVLCIGHHNANWRSDGIT